MRRKNILVLMISLSLVLLLGSSYALLRSSQVGSNSYVINVGTLQVTFEDNQTEKLSLENMYPMSDKEGSSQSKELGFVVKNTGTVASYYDVYLEETSTNPEFKTVIRFISNKNNQGYNSPKTLSEDKYIDVGGYLEPDASSSYKVKLWLDYDADNTYMSDETSIKVFKAKVVIKSFQESEYAKDEIKSKLVKYEESSKDDFTGGLIAVNTDGNLYNETESKEKIREYRYSGPDVNNYVTFNDETWRIIGVFKDETGEEHVKIVRNEVLNGIFPETYKIDDVIYNIKEDDYNVYFNEKVEGDNNNDWTTVGIQYWLNTKTDDNGSIGYLNYIKDSSFSMIADTKYYLGNLTYYSNAYNEGSNTLYGIKETPKEAYVKERSAEVCSSTSPNGCLGGYIWPGNQATWTGKIALLYPSDYGLSANSKYWNTILGFGTFNEDAFKSTWLQTRFFEWLISPSSMKKDKNIYWNRDGYINTYTRKYNSLRPCLYLKSNVKIISGTGEENNPYILSVE